MLLRMVIEAEAEDPQTAKEDLAMALERWKPARVVEVAPVYRQERMDLPTAGAMVNGSRRQTPSVSGFAAASSRFARPSGVPEGAEERVVVGPFARADAAFRAAMEEIR